MTAHVALDGALTTSTPERKGEVCLVALWPFIVVVAIPCDRSPEIGGFFHARSADSGVSAIRAVPVSMLHLDSPA